MTMKYIKGLDTLRALAVILVIIHHWGLPFVSDKAPSLYQRILVPDGRFGVDLFFVLSGFLITSILLEARLTGGTAPRMVIRNFIIRRSLRIFPLYYAVIVLLFIVKFPFVSDHLPWFL